MFQVRNIENFDAPELQPYRTMRRQLEHRQQGIFVAEGEKVVRRLIESPFELVSVLLPEKWYHDLEPLLSARTDSFHVFLAEKKLLETLTGFSMYQGLLAVAKVPRLPSLGEVLARSPRPRLFVAVESLSSAQNMGAVVRNCAAFGVHGLIVGETCCSPFLRRAVRSSMGAVLHLTIIETSSLVGSLRELRASGVRCLSAHPHAEGCTLPESDLTGDCCLVFGSEGYGLSADVLAQSDQAVSVPMPPAVDSLNVGTATGVFLYEANRQRRRFTGT